METCKALFASTRHELEVVYADFERIVAPADFFARRINSHRKFDSEQVKQTLFKILHQPTLSFALDRVAWKVTYLVRVISGSGQLVCKDVVRTIVKRAGWMQGSRPGGLSCTRRWPSLADIRRRQKRALASQLCPASLRHLCGVSRTWRVQFSGDDGEVGLPLTVMDQELQFCASYLCPRARECDSERRNAQAAAHCCHPAARRARRLSARC